DTCHRTSAWTPAGFNHANVVAGTCATCHNGTTATGKPPNHIPTTASCDTCHRTTAWLPTSFNHQGIAAGSCATCHNGTAATGKPASRHVPTTAACDACHTTTTAWLPVPATYAHAGIAAGTCASCHGGTFANIDVKTANHITTTASGDARHPSTARKPASSPHPGGAAGSCPTRRTADLATGKPASRHVPTTAACDACHTTTTKWLPVPATYAHAGIAAGSCSSCHGGTFTNIDVKKANH